MTGIIVAFKLMFAAAASLVIGGSSVGSALTTAGQAQGLSCPQFGRVTKRLNDESRKERFFLAIPNGAAIPKAYDDRILGNCSLGSCEIKANGCHYAAQYNYDCGPLTAGYRVCEVIAHPYLAKGWKLYAQATAGWHWYDSLGQVVTACTNNFTGAQCLAMLQADEKCWLLNDGNYCRHGKEYGPNLGGDEACHYAKVVGPMPCVSYRGARSALADVEKVFAGEDYDNL